MKCYSFKCDKLLITLSHSNDLKTHYVTRKSGLKFDTKSFTDYEVAKAIYIEEIGKLL